MTPTTSLFEWWTSYLRHPKTMVALYPYEHG
jgi:hypothetical protein